MFAPLAAAYRFALPPSVRKHIALVGTNFQYPGRVINCVLQAKWKAAYEETERFAINTTVGVFGAVRPGDQAGSAPSS